MLLPRKLKKGDVFKTQTVNTVNHIIDYLRSLTPVAGDNIFIDRKESGFTINSIKPRLQNKTTTPTQVKPLLLPFQMGELYDAESNTTQLTVRPGRQKFFCDQFITRDVWTKNYNEEDSETSNAQELIDVTNFEDGEYYILFSNVKNADSETEDKILLYAVRGDVYEDQIFSFPGFETFGIGIIEIYTSTVIQNQTEVEAKHIKVLRQQTISTLPVLDRTYKPLQSYAIVVDNTPQSDLKILPDAFTIQHINVNAGILQVGCLSVTIPDTSLQVLPIDEGSETANVYVYIVYQINDGNLVAKIHQSNEVQSFFQLDDEDMKGYAQAFMIAMYTPTTFLQLYEGGVLKLNKTTSNIILSTNDNADLTYDNYADLLPYKLHSRLEVQPLEEVLVKEKETKDYIDFFVTSGNSQQSSKAQHIPLTGNTENNLFMFAKFRYDKIEKFDEAKWLSLNYNGLSESNEIEWTDYGKILVDSTSKKDKYISEICKAGSGINIQLKEDALYFSLEDSETSPSGDYSYNGPFKIQKKAADTYVITNGTGAEKSKAFVNGVEFELGTTAVARGQDIYVKMNLEDNSIGIVNKSQADTPTTVCHYIGKISDTGKIHQQWTGGVIYRTIAAPPNIQFMLDETDILGQLAEVIVTYDEETCLSTVMLRMKDTVPEGVLAFESRTSYRNYPLTTCHIAAENSSNSGS